MIDVRMDRVDGEEGAGVRGENNDYDDDSDDNDVEFQRHRHEVRGSTPKQP